MSAYVINTYNNSGRTRNLLLALPLTLITIFCFGFVLLQPSPNLKKPAVASSGSPDPVIQTPAGQLPALPMAEQSSLAKLSTVPLAVAPQADIPVVTANPQAQPSASVLTNLQIASPANTKASVSKNKNRHQNDSHRD